MTNREILLKTDTLSKVYSGDVRALDGVSFCVEVGEFLAIMGPSGSGKSTLLHLLGALDRPTTGEIFFSQERLSQIRDPDHFRSRMVGFVFQLHNLLPTLTARENIEIPMRATSIPRGDREKMVKTLLELVQLSDRANHLPAQLSGGQRQKVAIARAVANNPRLLLADEPTGNLDTASGREIMTVFQRLNQELGTTIIIVTHDPAVARMTKRVVALQDGQIVRDEFVENPYIEDMKEFRASALGQALLKGKLPEGAMGLGLEALLPSIQIVLRGV